MVTWSSTSEDNINEEIWVHSNLVNDKDWEVVKRKPSPKEKKKVRRQSLNMEQATKNYLQ